MNSFKVLTLAVISLLAANKICAENTEAKAATTNAAAVNNAVAATDSINGDDFNVTFKKLNERQWQAILTNSTKPFNIVVDDSEWLREIYTFEGYATRNDTLFVQLSGGYEFGTNNAEWRNVLAGQKVVLTEIRSNQGRTTKSYYSLTALEDEQVQYYAAHQPSAKPAKQRRTNASTPAPTKDTKKSKGKKGKKGKMTEDELIEEIMGGNANGRFSVEIEGDPKL